MIVFKEVEDVGGSMFVWFRAASDQELMTGSDHIVAEAVLTESEHNYFLNQGEDEYDDEPGVIPWKAKSKNERLLQEGKP